MAITINGTTGLNIPNDSGKLQLGASADLKLYHDGTDTHIDNNTSNLRIKSNDIQLRDTSENFYIDCNAGGSLDLYNNGSKKLSTTSNGIEVHGSTDNARISFGDAYANSAIGYVGLNRFAIDSHDGLEVRDVSDSYATRMKIASDGVANFIGKGSNFALQSNHHCLQNNNASSYAMQVVNTASYGYGMEIRVNSNIASREALYVYSTADYQSKAAILSSGTFYSRTNNYGSFSDVKLKENIVDASSQWNDLKAIKVRNFNFISDTSNTKLLGVVAQELETVCPSLIETINDKEINEQGERVETGTSTKSVKYSILYMKAIKALQEAQTRIETLETKVAALESA